MGIFTSIISTYIFDILFLFYSWELLITSLLVFTMPRVMVSDYTPLPSDLSDIVAGYLSPPSIIICRIGDKCYHKEVENNRATIKKCDCSRGDTKMGITIFDPSENTLMLERKGRVKWFSYTLVPNIFIGMYETGSIRCIERSISTIYEHRISYIEMELKRKLFPDTTLRIDNIYDYLDLTQLPKIRRR